MAWLFYVLIGLFFGFWLGVITLSLAQICGDIDIEEITNGKDR